MQYSFWNWSMHGCRGGRLISLTVAVTAFIYRVDSGLWVSHIPVECTAQLIKAEWRTSLNADGRDECLELCGESSRVSQHWKCLLRWFEGEKYKKCFIVSFKCQVQGSVANKQFILMWVCPYSECHGGHWWTLFFFLSYYSVFKHCEKERAFL